MTVSARQTVSAPARVAVSDSARRLRREYLDLWWALPDDLPSLGAVHAPSEQAANVRLLDGFLAAVSREVERLPTTPEERVAAQGRLFAAFETLARGALGFQECHVHAVLSEGFTHMGVAFSQAARRLDPVISGADIYQATRNAWTMAALQEMLGLPVTLTPAVFAYSMLYPYTDNYLDDPAIPAGEKRAFGERFARRLAGEDIAPANAHEAAIYRLVRMIERQYAREAFPAVFESLLAIHRAQTESVRLMRRNASPYEVDVLGIALDKGGTSVLADGYLVAGDLTEEQARFLYGYGAFLQLVDDLQDVEQDRAAGLQTIFSQTARRWPLDAVTSRTLRFGEWVLADLGCFPAGEGEALKELLARSVVQILVQAAGTHRRLYTRPYIEALEPHVPFRFRDLDQRRGSLARRRPALMRLVEAMAVADELEHGPLAEALAERA